VEHTEMIPGFGASDICTFQTPTSSIFLLICTDGIARIAVLVGLGIAGARAQTAPAARMSFDVISIKESKPDAPPRESLENNRFTANLPLVGYIVFA